MQIRAGQIAVIENNPFQIFAFQPAYMFAGRQKHHLFRLIRHRNVLRQSSQAKRATGRIFCHFGQRRKPPRHFNVLNVTAGKTGTVKRIQRIQILVAVNYKTAVFVFNPRPVDQSKLVQHFGQIAVFQIYVPGTTVYSLRQIRQRFKTIGIIYAETVPQHHSFAIRIRKRHTDVVQPVVRQIKRSQDYRIFHIRRQPDKAAAA